MGLQFRHDLNQPFFRQVARRYLFQLDYFEM